MDIAFKYTEFWDVPRFFALEHRGFTFVFNAPFLPFRDEYSDFYLVYISPGTPEDIESINIAELELVQLVPINDIAFDPSKRSSVSAQCIDALFIADEGDLSEYKQTGS